MLYSSKVCEKFLLTVTTVALVVSLMGPIANGSENLRVPEDASLTVLEYAELGVPDPGKAWSANEFIQALRSLERINRNQLPRAGSSRSQILFDRLVISHGREFDLLYDAAAGEASATNPPASLPTLYSTGSGDGLLFDRELVTIRARTLSRTLTTIPTRAELLALASRFSERMKASESDVDRTRLALQMEQAEAAVATASALVKRDVTDLLVVAGIPELQDSARLVLVENAETLFPELPKYLPDDDVRWVAIVLKGAASPDFNASIRTRLLDLAEQLEAMIGNR